MKKSKRSSKTYTNARDRYLQQKYGITLGQYEIMLMRQDFSCAICKKDRSHFSKSLAVDHNHASGRIRGLLCFYCNKRVVGRNTIESATKILKYLLKYDVEAE